MSIAAMSLPAALFIVLLGPAMGSFMALLADRLPQGAPVLAARSACAGCGRQLAMHDLIPLVSFVWLRGRCRHCSSAIPPRLLYAEILGLGAGVLAVVAGGSGAEAMASAVFLWLLLGLGLADLQWYRLPDPLTLATGAAGLALAGLTPPQGLAPGPVAALAGAAFGGGAAFAIRWVYFRVRGREGMGLGDVKLIAALGAFTGPLALPSLLLVAATIGLAGALATWRAGLAGTRAIPFGTALSLAAAVLWVVSRAS